MRININLSQLANRATPGSKPATAVGFLPVAHFPASSNVSAAQYNPEDGTLELMFRNGSTYRYVSVPQATYEALLSAPSTGKFVSQQIKGRYPVSKVSS